MLSNFINHHQTPVADELYNMQGVEYRFIETKALPEEQRNLGYSDFSNKPYVISAYKSNEEYQKAINLIDNADVVIVGSAPENMIIDRLRSNKLTFRYSERFFKKRPWYFPDPRVWMELWKKHIRYKNKPLYMLAASAYTANDVYAIGAYKNKVYKWGYFPRVDDFPLEACENLDASSGESAPHIMWCARFLRLKHPELPVMLAKRLKDKGYNFHLDMYGRGEELYPTQQLVKSLAINDNVSFYGSLPNEEILKEMRKHEIFLFTSDRNEGWGAVLNESMSNGCAVVASNQIGSVPFLIQDGENGMVFKSGDLDSLTQKVCYLLDNPTERLEMAKKAIHTMREVWSPANAAKRFVELAHKLLTGEITPYTDGPCSKAYPYKNN